MEADEMNEDTRKFYTVPGVRLGVTFFYVCGEGHTHPVTISAAEWTSEIKPDLVAQTRDNYLAMFPGGRIATEEEIDAFMEKAGGFRPGEAPKQTSPKHEQYFVIPTNDTVN